MPSSEAFAEPFSFRDLGQHLVERPLREMNAVEVLWAWRWQVENATECEQYRFWTLIRAAIPDWPDGMSVGQTVHRFWPFGRAPH